MDLRGPTSKGREGGERKGRGKGVKGKGREKGGRGEKREGPPPAVNPPVKKSWIRACSYLNEKKTKCVFCSESTS